MFASCPASGAATLTADSESAHWHVSQPALASSVCWRLRVTEHWQSRIACLQEMVCDNAPDSESWSAFFFFVPRGLSCLHAPPLCSSPAAGPAAAMQRAARHVSRPVPSPRIASCLRVRSVSSPASGSGAPAASDIDVRQASLRSPAPRRRSRPEPGAPLPLPPPARPPARPRREQIAYPVNVHRSNAASLVSAVPPIAVSGSHVAMCDGGGGATGHPLEYIQLELRAGAAPSTCRYCGLRYVAAHHH